MRATDTVFLGRRQAKCLRPTRKCPDPPNHPWVDRRATKTLAPREAPRAPRAPATADPETARAPPMFFLTLEIFIVIESSHVSSLFPKPMFLPKQNALSERTPYHPDLSGTPPGLGQARMSPG